MHSTSDVFRPAALLRPPGGQVAMRRWAIMGFGTEAIQVAGYIAHCDSGPVGDIIYLDGKSKLT